MYIRNTYVCQSMNTYRFRLLIVSPIHCLSRNKVKCEFADNKIRMYLILWGVSIDLELLSVLLNCYTDSDNKMNYLKNYSIARPLI